MNDEKQKIKELLTLIVEHNCEAMKAVFDKEDDTNMYFTITFCDGDTEQWTLAKWIFKMYSSINCLDHLELKEV